MGRPLFSAQTHPASCLCQACTASSAPTHPVPSPTTLPRAAISRTSRSDTSLGPPTSRLTDQDIIQTLASSRESIQRVSSAIEAAYERLIALTNRLQERLDIMSNEPRQERSDSSMGPDHSAILLSEPTSASSDITVRNSATNESGTPANTLFDHPVSASTPAQSTSRTIETIRQRFMELTERVPSDGPNAALSDGESSRPSSAVLFGPRSRDPAQARRSFLMTYLMHGRDSNSSDPTTTLGRRVEARAAAVSSHAESSTDARVSDTLGESSFTVNLLNRHQERLLESSRSFRRASVSPTDGPSSAGATTETRTPATADSRTFEPPSARPWQIRDRTALWRENLRDRRPVTSLGARHSSSSGLSRVSSRLEVNSLPPLVPRRAPAPERRSSVSDDSDMPELGAFFEPDDELRLDPESGQLPVPRGLYLSALSRGSTVRYDDPISISDAEDDDDPYSWLMNDDARRPQPPLVGLDSARSRSDMLGRTRASRDAGSSNTLPDPRPPSTVVWELAPYSALSPPSMSAPRTGRRRPRLDLDGNEIPTDEEEEYERNRSHMRARAQALTLRAANSESTPLLRDYMSSTMPPPPPSWSATTRAPDDLPVIPDDDSPRVNLGASALRSSQSLPEGSSQSRWARPTRPRRTISPIREYGSATPFHASPIPWTPVDLTPSSRARVREKRLAAKSRSVRSPLAGR